jgi:hypothetical protein
MNPGRNLDAEIARKIFRFVVMIDSETEEPRIRDNELRKFVPVPPYSTDTTTAHTIVQKFRAAGCTFNISNEVEGDEHYWTATIAHPKLAALKIGAKGVTLPHAICSAVLQFNQLFQIQ